jgi:hypothetical protein
MVKTLKNTFPKTIEINVSLAEDLPPVAGNATQLHQVLMNLCVNARDAMPYGWKLTIEAEGCLTPPMEGKLVQRLTAASAAVPDDALFAVCIRARSNE